MFCIWTWSFKVFSFSYDSLSLWNIWTIFAFVKISSKLYFKKKYNCLLLIINHAYHGDLSTATNLLSYLQPLLLIFIFWHAEDDYPSDSFQGPLYYFSCPHIFTSSLWVSGSDFLFMRKQLKVFSSDHFQYFHAKSSISLIFARRWQLNLVD